VSKSVALYQNYVHIKAYLAMDYIPIAWKQVKVMFIPETTDSSYTKAKAYCPIILLSFIQKMMQNW
jgi:hypothetical protein